MYKGNFSKGLPHGWGCYHWSNGNLYQGEYMYGKAHGLGIFVWSDSGDIYEGSFKDDIAHGYGLFRYSDGSVYEGRYVGGKLEGEGVYRWWGGAVYSGGFRGGKFEGWGVFRYGPGDGKGREVYEGSWKEGKKEGKGIMRYVKGKIEEGIWSADVLVKEETLEPGWKGGGHRRKPSVDIGKKKKKGGKKDKDKKKKYFTMGSGRGESKDSLSSGDETKEPTAITVESILAKLQLSKYEDIIIKREELNTIDRLLLCNSEHLTTIGLPLGPRIALLNEISNLKSKSVDSSHSSILPLLGPDIVDMYRLVKVSPDVNGEQSKEDKPEKDSPVYLIIKIK